uniref:Uncharacterized protein n=1 Tax=Schistosoma japonicum TaxID=6182 RepID=Q5C4N4_SCHJA|nr:unknown [Schistosoma japonicum]
MEKWNINSPDIPIVFEINETGNWIKKNGFTKVVSLTVTMSLAGWIAISG